MPPLLNNLNLQPFVSAWIAGPSIVVLCIGLLWWIKRRSLRFVKKKLRPETSWIWAESLVDALSPSLSIAILAAGLALLDRVLPLSSRTDHTFEVVLSGLVTLALFTFLDRISGQALLRASARSAAVQGALGLLQGATRGFIIALGLLVFLDSIGISITPIAASLGIGSLAIALALQDTLANLFAGVYMIAEKPIEAGNFVKLEGGEQGYISKVGWRSTHIRTLSDHMVVVPNAKLAGSVIANFSLPRNEIGVSLEIGVDYNSDLQQVEDVTLEVAKCVVAQMAEANPAFLPRVRFHSFGDSSVNLTVWLGARDFMGGQLLQHEFIKRLHVQYRKERISIPFPTRTLDITSPNWIRLQELLALRSERESQNGNKSGASEPNHAS